MFSIPRADTTKEKFVPTKLLILLVFSSLEKVIFMKMMMFGLLLMHRKFERTLKHEKMKRKIKRKFAKK